MASLAVRGSDWEPLQEVLDWDSALLVLVGRVRQDFLSAFLFFGSLLALVPLG